MPNPYDEGNFAWLWYQAWLPVITAVGTLAVLVYVFSYPVEGIRGTVAKVVGAIAFLGTLPLSQERIGIGVNVVEESMFMLNVLGFVAAIAVAYFHYSYRKVPDPWFQPRVQRCPSRKPYPTSRVAIPREFSTLPRSRTLRYRERPPIVRDTPCPTPAEARPRVQRTPERGVTPSVYAIPHLGGLHHE